MTDHTPDSPGPYPPPPPGYAPGGYPQAPPYPPYAQGSPGPYPPPPPTPGYAASGYQQVPPYPPYASAPSGPYPQSPPPGYASEGYQQVPPYAPYALPPSEKSSAIAILLTILWPGAGHLYLGLTQKALPFVVANAIGIVLFLTLILWPVGFVIWLVTLVMMIGSVNQDTEFVNHAIRQGRRVTG